MARVAKGKDNNLEIQTSIIAIETVCEHLKKSKTVTKMNRYRQDLAEKMKVRRNPIRVDFRR